MSECRWIYDMALESGLKELGRNCGSELPKGRMAARSRISERMLNGGEADHDPRYRIAVIAYHPIQYQAPLFRLLASDSQIDLRVFFCSGIGAEEYWDPGFSRPIRWDLPLYDGYPYVILPNWSPMKDQGRFLGLINPALVRELWAGNFDALMIHGWSRLSDWIGLLTASVLNIPVLLRAEASSLPRRSHPIKAVLRSIFLRSLFGRISAFLSPGSNGATFYREFAVPNERVFIMPYAVDNTKFRLEAEQFRSEAPRLKMQLGIPVDAPVVLFSGKLTSRKRPMDLLEAFVRARGATDAALIFVGDGEIRTALENDIRARRLPGIHLVGFQNQTEISRFYGLSDLFVLPSAYETWGLVINEAMCFGLPIVATDRVGASGDLVRPGVNGFLYPVGDIESLAGHLHTLLNDAALRRRMGESSEAIISGWNYDADVAAFKRCMTAVLASAR